LTARKKPGNESDQNDPYFNFQHWPKASVEADLLTIEFVKLSNLHEAKFQSCLDQYDLLRADFNILRLLRCSPPPHIRLPSDLATPASLSNPGLSKALRRLQEHRLILRAKSKDDKRKLPVRLSAKGKRVIEKVQHSVNDFHKSFWKVLNKNEKAAFKKLLAATSLKNT